MYFGEYLYGNGKALLLPNINPNQKQSYHGSVTIIKIS